MEKYLILLAFSSLFLASSRNAQGGSFLTKITNQRTITHVLWNGVGICSGEGSVRVYSDPYGPSFLSGMTYYITSESGSVVSSPLYDSYNAEYDNNDYNNWLNQIIALIICQPYATGGYVSYGQPLGAAMAAGAEYTADEVMNSLYTVTPQPVSGEWYSYGFGPRVTTSYGRYFSF